MKKIKKRRILILLTIIICWLLNISQKYQKNNKVITALSNNAITQSIKTNKKLKSKSTITLFLKNLSGTTWKIHKEKNTISLYSTNPISLMKKIQENAQLIPYEIKSLTIYSLKNEVLISFKKNLKNLNSL